MPSQPSSTLYWWAIGVTAIIDVIPLLLARLLRRPHRSLQPTFLIVSLLFWGALYTWAFHTWHDSVGATGRRLTD